MRTTALIRRYRDVARVLIRHGFVDVVDALHLRRYLALGSRLLPRRVRIDPTLSRARRFRRSLEELGPTFVKFGQALSIRTDVLPPELIAELTLLQDRAPSLEPGVAERIIEAELDRPLAELFGSFDATPFAAASMAQVHRAELPTGEPVVVKVRRPGIERVIAGDLAMLAQLAQIAERHLPGADVVDPPALVDEFARTIRAELDLAREGRNIERCARHFAGDRTVRFPAVHRDRTTSAVLTLEYLDGIRISALADSGADRDLCRMLARRGADAMLAQVFVHGFFHADPHPGNLLVLPGGVIGFLDFGIVGRLDEPTRDTLVRAVAAAWRRDVDRLAAVSMELTDPRRDVDVRALRRDLLELVDTYGDVPIGELVMTDVLRDVVSTLARHQLRFPPDLLLLVKAIVTIEGVGRQLDPDFRMVEYAAPVAERLWRERHSTRVLAERATDALREATMAVHQIPADVGAVMRKLRDDRLEVQFVHRNLEHFVREMDRSSNRLSFAVVIAAVIVGSSLVMQTGAGATAYGYPIVGLIGFLIAGLLGVGLAIGVIRSGRL